MIKQISSVELDNDSIFAGKILTLRDAYGVENCCRFYKQKQNLTISALGRDVVIAGASSSDPEELAAFLRMSDARTVLLPAPVMRQLEDFLPCEKRYNHIMRYDCADNPNGFTDNLDRLPDLDVVFGIIKDEFPIEYSSWLTDLSHRIRHGFSVTYLLENASTVTALYDRDGTIFLTQVATLPECRGKGLATRLLRGVCGTYKASGKESVLICRDARLAFYEHVGFVKVGEAVNIYRLL